MLISLEHVHVSASAIKNMFVLVCAVGVDLGFVAVAVVIYCFTVANNSKSHVLLVLNLECFP